MIKALITGVTGQDGSQSLTEKGGSSTLRMDSRVARCGPVWHVFWHTLLPFLTEQEPWLAGAAPM